MCRRSHPSTVTSPICSRTLISIRFLVCSSIHWQNRRKTLFLYNWVISRSHHRSTRLSSLVSSRGRRSRGPDQGWIHALRPQSASSGFGRPLCLSYFVLLNIIGERGKCSNVDIITIKNFILTRYEFRLYLLYSTDILIQFVPSTADVATSSPTNIIFTAKLRYSQFVNFFFDIHVII